MLALLGLLAVAANLRSPLTSLPPLVDEISQALGLSSVAAGMLTSVPLVCMGLLSPLAPTLAARYGLDRSIGIGVALIALGTAGRAVAGVPGLYLGALLLGTGIAIAGALVPAAVRQAVPQNVGAATSLTTVLTMSMAALAAATAVPLSTRVGLPAALAVWAAPAVLALLIWAPQLPGPPRGGSTPGRAPLPWRSGTAWLVTGYLTANSLMFYSLMAWLPSLYLDHGWTGSAAGVVLGVFGAWQLAIAVVLSAVLHRCRGDRRLLYVLAAVLSGLGMLGVALAPAAAWVMIALVGVGLGGGFTLGLVQLAVHVVTALDSARLSAMVFLVSFLCSAVGPALVGWSRDAVGTLTPAFVVLAGLAAGQAAIGLYLRPERRVGARG